MGRNKSKKYSYIDLFCGAGGLSLGFSNAGFSCVQAIDNDPAAISTYESNFEDHISCDEINLDTRLENADVIIGGPPCQGFTSAGRRIPNDKRNTLVRIFSTLVASVKPKAFVFENVEGFLTASKGERVMELLSPLIKAGYRIHLRKINAANYGTPQHRKRVIAIGGLKWNPNFPEPTHKAFGAPGSEKIKINNHKILPLTPTFDEALQELPPPSPEPPGIPNGHFLRKMSDSFLIRAKLLKPGQTMKDLPESYWHESYRNRAFRRVKDGTPTECRGGAPAGLKRLHGNQPSKAITSGALREFVHPTENRFLTMRECAKLQTFPDEFDFKGNTSQIILQIGNAVPPLLAEKIAESLRRDLDSEKEIFKSGALLSFLPTNAFGMSPSLEKVCNNIHKEFGVLPKNREVQIELWL